MCLDSPGALLGRPPGEADRSSWRQSIHDGGSVTGRDPRERRQLRERRPVTPPRQQRERMLRTLVVAGVVASVGVFAVVAQARQSGLAAPGAVDQVAGEAATADGATPAGMASPDPAATEAPADTTAA